MEISQSFLDMTYQNGQQPHSESEDEKVREKKIRNSSDLPERMVLSLKFNEPSIKYWFTQKKQQHQHSYFWNV